MSHSLKKCHFQNLPSILNKYDMLNLLIDVYKPTNSAKLQDLKQKFVVWPFPLWSSHNCRHILNPLRVRFEQSL